MPPTGTPARVTPSGISTGGEASPVSTGARAAITRTEMRRRRITWRDRTYDGGRNQGSSDPKRGNLRPNGGATAAASPRQDLTLGNNRPGAKRRRTQ